jgi:mannose-6-phosphate isomerase
MAVLLEGRIQRYPWGSTTMIQELCGWPKDGQPIAELWFGTHSKAPAIVQGTGEDLLQLLRRDRATWLGAPTQSLDDTGLPFLLKLIAVARPLSIQAHPNATQAKSGHEREQERGIPINAPERCYPDPNHKPELLVALSRFHALAGFDEPERIAATLALIDNPDLRRLSAPLHEGGDIEASFTGLLQCDVVVRSGILAALERKLDALPGDHRGEKLTRAQQLLTEYPGDLGALLSVFLRDVVLEPGQALYVRPGLLHCYLSGLAVEIMANSDNVIRGGLTKKHVDVPELQRIVDYHTRPTILDKIVDFALRNGDTETAYGAPVTEFGLTRVNLGSHDPATLSAASAEMILAVAHPVILQDANATLRVMPGQAAFVATGTEYQLQGDGACFRARAGATRRQFDPSYRPS